MFVFFFLLFSSKIKIREYKIIGIILTRNTFFNTPSYFRKLLNNKKSSHKFDFYSDPSKGFFCLKIIKCFWGTVTTQIETPDKQIKPVICEYPEALRVDCRDFLFYFVCVCAQKVVTILICTHKVNLLTMKSFSDYIFFATKIR